MALALDGSVGTFSNTGAASFTLPALTTANTNDIIVVGVVYNGSGNTGLEGISSVTGGGLTFTSRSFFNSFGSGISEWTAVASGTLGATVLTVNFVGSPTYYVATAFGISGANTSTIYDSNGSIPVSNGTGADPTFSTSNANDFVLGIMRFSGGSPTSGSGWTAIYNPGGEAFLAQYRIFSTTQSGTTCLVGTGTGTENGSLVDAIIQAGIVIPPVPSRGPMPKQIYIMP